MADQGGARWIVEDRGIGDLDAETIYAILRLRVDVFVVEQACAYPELDGRDLEPTTRHIWIAEPAHQMRPAAYLRVLREDGSSTRDVHPRGKFTQPWWRIGRVVTAPDRRGAGLSGRLLGWTLDRYPGVVVLDAQSHLQAFYERLGFVVDGPAFVEDGIPHVPMRRQG